MRLLCWAGFTSPCQNIGCSSQPNECFQLRAPCTTPPPNLPVPEGTTLCPQLTTRESAWLCVFEQKVDRKRVLENSRVDYLRAACVFYDGNLSGRQTLQIHLMLVSKLLLKIIHILLSLLDPKLRSSPQLFRSDNISWQFNW